MAMIFGSVSFRATCGALIVLVGSASPGIAAAAPVAPATQAAPRAVPAPEVGPLPGSADKAVRKQRAPRSASRTRRGKPTALERRLNAIGQMVIGIVGGEPDGIFLYVEITDRWIDASLFRDEGKFVRHFDLEGTEVGDLVRQMWKAQPKAKRWSVMEYEIRHGAFNVGFDYPDDVDVETIDGRRRTAVLHKRFGNKPVVYSPPPGMYSS